ncbi:DNA glycosylase [Apodospora peruviana]|uniref:Endonuclease III homolog n=1 Tax=Apodospora peruviana TaxID=516989 RepID=A0AAE0IJ55_9PEZI|nr:DNA glycosylase [Apodospora peruviana]
MKRASSRVVGAKETTTSKFFDNAVATALPRRSTRSSARQQLAARFSYRDDSSSDSKGAVVDNDGVNDEVTFGSDIEDAVVIKKSRSSASPPPQPGTTTRKRKRTATTTMKSEPSAEPSRRNRGAVKSELETEIITQLTTEETDVVPSPIKSRARKQPARKAVEPATGETKIQPPSDWEEIYALVKEMRISGPAANAAVDTMGCERLAMPEASAKDRRFHTLVALMLSSQTKDTVNAEAMYRLKTELPPHKEGAPPGLNLDNILAVEPGLLNDLIGKVGFHNNKTKYIKQAALILRDQHGGDIPPTIEGLMALPGVGPKMAHLCMSADNGWGRVEGIGVDVHVHRITNLWGWQSPPSKTPEETRLALQSWLPHDKWKEINWLLVGFGQKVCLPVGRKCGDCTLGLRGLCKSAERKKVTEGRRRVKVEQTTTTVKLEDGDEKGGVVNIKKEEMEEEEESGEKTEVVNEDVPVKEEVKEEATEEVEEEAKLEVKEEDLLSKSEEHISNMFDDVHIF